MLIAGTHVKSLSHRPDWKTRVDATKYFEFKGHFVTQNGQILKSSQYHVIHEMKGMEETNTLVIFLGRNIHLITV